jgi:hypothetical protein
MTLRQLIAKLVRLIRTSSCNHCGHSPLPCPTHDGPTLATVDKPWPRRPS